MCGKKETPNHFSEWVSLSITIMILAIMFRKFGLYDGRNIGPLLILCCSRLLSRKKRTRDLDAESGRPFATDTAKAKDTITCEICISADTARRAKSPRYLIRILTSAANS